MEIPSAVKEKMTSLHIEKHPKSICIANYKGGVGKTTITTLLGYYLANKGYKVLLLDIDPQCSLSLAVGFEIEKVSKTDNTIYHLVTPNKWHKATKVKYQEYINAIPDIYAPKSLKIIKGAFDVDQLDIEIIREIVNNESTEYMLYNYCKNMLNEYDDFDYILVDCPPNKMYLTQAMLRACSYYMSVTIPDKISVYGMPRLMTWVNQIPSNEKPYLLGCVLNTVNRLGGHEFGTTNQKNAEQELVNTIGGKLNIKEKSVIGGKPILAHIPRLDVISRFLSQGAIKIAWFDLNDRASEQRTVSDLMMTLVKSIENRIAQYAKI